MKNLKMTFLAITAVFGLSGCIDGFDPGDLPDKLICGGHGKLGDTQCECDPGFVLDTDNRFNCVKAKEDPAPACGGHGYLHGDHCHCDDGYVVDPNNLLNCVKAKEDPAPACGGHGYLHGDHCHCNEGYVVDPNNLLNCVKAKEDPAPACGGHGHLHGDKCHCDDGYIVDPKNPANCVAKPAPVCGGHGHLHGDYCHCDDGYIVDPNNPANCVAKPAPVCGGHGHLHGDHCHCDDGYIVDPNNPANCVAKPAPVCGGHGHLHGDHCHCDDGYIVDPNNPANCVAKPAPESSRLAISDTEKGLITILNLNDGSTAAAVELSSPARVYATETGRYAVALQREGNRVDFIDSGLHTENKGSSADSTPALPRKLDFALDGTKLGSQKPVHYVSHSGYLTVHFDGKWDAEGGAHIPSKNVVIAENQLAMAQPQPHLVVETAPQHGVSMVTESGHLLMTEPSLDREKSSLPSGVSVRDLSTGAVLQSFNDGNDFQASCWGLHGEAQIGSSALFACHQKLDGGALLLNWDDKNAQFDAKKIAYPGYPKAPNRTSIVASHPKNSYFVGQWGTYSNGQSFYDGLVRISASGAEIKEEDTLELGAVYCSFAFEKSAGNIVAALTRAGKLHVVDVNNWRKLGVVDVLPDTQEAGTCSGRLTMGDNVAYVSNTEKGSVAEINLQSLQITRSFTVGGSPGGMAVLGNSKH